MKKRSFTLLVFSLVTILSACSDIDKKGENQKSVMIGYVGGYNGHIVDTEQIRANAMSHIHDAF